MAEWSLNDSYKFAESQNMTKNHNFQMSKCYNSQHTNI